MRSCSSAASTCRSGAGVVLALKERITPLAQHLGVTVREIRTNSRELGLQDWLDSSMAQLAACLHNYSHLYSHALVGRSGPYDHPESISLGLFTGHRPLAVG